MPVTIRDVARAAGVSPMAVSKVLHGKGSNVRISTETAAIISRAALDLDYRPNGLARRFRSSRTNTIGLVFDHRPQFRHHSRYYNDIIEGATESAFANEYSLTLCPELIGTRAIDACSDGRFDGILWARTRGEENLDRWISEDKMCAVILHVPISGDSTNVPVVTWDNQHAVRLIIDHLHQLGHRNVAVASTTPDGSNHEYIERFESLRSEAYQRGWKALVWEHWTQDADEMPGWWKENSQCTAIVALNEESALAIMKVAKVIGIKMPDELSIITFDSTLTCEITQPKLTAIHQPLAEMAARATTLLIHSVEARLAGNSGPSAEIYRYPARLDLRESTARPSNHSQS